MSRWDERRVYAGQTLRERMMDRVMPIPECGCWIHMGREVGRGYAKEPNDERAHRAFYREFVGAIPDGMVVAHKCDVPSCVNPAHLEVCTQGKNIADKVRKNRQAKGERMAAAKLSDADVLAIRKELEAPRLGIYTELGRRFGVHRAVIARISKGKVWRHVA